MVNGKLYETAEGQCRTCYDLVTSFSHGSQAAVTFSVLSTQNSFAPTLYGWGQVISSILHAYISPRGGLTDFPMPVRKAAEGQTWEATVSLADYDIGAKIRGLILGHLDIPTLDVRARCLLQWSLSGSLTSSAIVFSLYGPNGEALTSKRL